MADFGDALRNMGSVLNPQVAQQLGQEEQQGQGIQNQIGMLMLQKKMQEASPEYQAKMEALKNDKLYHAAVQDAQGDPTKIAAAASMYGKPEVAANIYNQQEARAARVQQAHDSLEARKMELQMRIDDKALDREQKERYNALMADLKQQQMQLASENAKNQFELKKMQFSMQGDKQLVQQTQALGKALEKANLPEADATLGAVEDVLKKHPEYKEYISGPKSAYPDAVVGPEIAAARQAFNKLFNVTLKLRSGAAVTQQELERLKQEFGVGFTKNPDQVDTAIEQARSIITKHYRSVATGHGPEALKAYNENLRGLGGSIVVDVPDKPKGGSDNDPLGLRQ